MATESIGYTLNLA